MKASMCLIVAAASLLGIGVAQAERVQVKDAKGKTVTVEKSRSFTECVRRSVKLGYPKDGAERFCAKWLKR